jgi:hypothetical protein
VCTITSVQNSGSLIEYIGTLISRSELDSSRSGLNPLRCGLSLSPCTWPDDFPAIPVPDRSPTAAAAPETQRVCPDGPGGPVRPGCTFFLVLLTSPASVTDWLLFSLSSACCGAATSDSVLGWRTFLSVSWFSIFAARSSNLALSENVALSGYCCSCSSSN